MTKPANLADAAWLKQNEITGLLTLLNRDGEEARVVGGAVRNTLLHMPVAEIDVATTAAPDEVLRRVEAAGWKAVPTGIEHGTVTVVINSHPFEVTTLRQDVETFGRKARVKFGRDWRADAERRDFTINALSASRRRKSLRLRRRARRYCGPPRALHRRTAATDRRRLSAHPALLSLSRLFCRRRTGCRRLHACIVARDGLDTLSRERVRMELLKLFVAPRAAPTLTVMAESGLLGPVLGGVPYVANFAKLAAIETALGSAPDPVRRLGALGVMVREDAERLSQRLRLSNAEFERLAALDGWWLISPSLSEQAARALLYQLGPQSFADRVLHAWAQAETGATDDSLASSF